MTSSGDLITLGFLPGEAVEYDRFTFEEVLNSSQLSCHSIGQHLIEQALLSDHRTSIPSCGKFLPILLPINPDHNHKKEDLYEMISSLMKSINLMKQARLKDDENGFLIEQEFQSTTVIIVPIFPDVTRLSNKWIDWLEENYPGVFNPLVQSSNQSSSSEVLPSSPLRSSLKPSSTITTLPVSSTPDAGTQQPKVRTPIQKSRQRSVIVACRKWWYRSSPSSPSAYTTSTSSSPSPFPSKVVSSPSPSVARLHQQSPSNTKPSTFHVSSSSSCYDEEKGKSTDSTEQPDSKNINDSLISFYLCPIVMKKPQSAIIVNTTTDSNQTQESTMKEDDTLCYLHHPRYHMFYWFFNIFCVSLGDTCQYAFVSNLSTKLEVTCLPLLLQEMILRQSEVITITGRQSSRDEIIGDETWLSKIGSSLFGTKLLQEFEQDLNQLIYYPMFSLLDVACPMTSTALSSSKSVPTCQLFNWLKMKHFDVMNEFFMLYDTIRHHKHIDEIDESYKSGEELKAEDSYSKLDKSILNAMAVEQKGRTIDEDLLDTDSREGTLKEDKKHTSNKLILDENDKDILGYFVEIDEEKGKFIQSKDVEHKQDDIIFKDTLSCTGAGNTGSQKSSSGGATDNNVGPTISRTPSGKFSYDPNFQPSTPTASLPSSPRASKGPMYRRMSADSMYPIAQANTSVLTPAGAAVVVAAANASTTNNPNAEAPLLTAVMPTSTSNKLTKSMKSRSRVSFHLLETEGLNSLEDMKSQGATLLVFPGESDNQIRRIPLDSEALTESVSGKRSPVMQTSADNKRSSVALLRLTSSFRVQSIPAATGNLLGIRGSNSTNETASTSVHSSLKRGVSRQLSLSQSPLYQNQILVRTKSYGYKGLLSHHLLESMNNSTLLLNFVVAFSTRDASIWLPSATFFGTRKAKKGNTSHYWTWERYLQQKQTAFILILAISYHCLFPLSVGYDESVRAFGMKNDVFEIPLVERINSMKLFTSSSQGYDPMLLRKSMTSYLWKIQVFQCTLLCMFAPCLIGIVGYLGLMDCSEHFSGYKWANREMISFRASSWSPRTSQETSLHGVDVWMLVMLVCYILWLIVSLAVSRENANVKPAQQSVSGSSLFALTSSKLGSSNGDRHSNYYDGVSRSFLELFNRCLVVISFVHLLPAYVAFIRYIVADGLTLISGIIIFSFCALVVLSGLEYSARSWYRIIYSCIGIIMKILHFLYVLPFYCVFVPSHCIIKITDTVATHSTISTVVEDADAQSCSEEEKSILVKVFLMASRSTIVMNAMISFSFLIINILFFLGLLQVYQRNNQHLAYIVACIVLLIVFVPIAIQLIAALFYWLRRILIRTGLWSCCCCCMDLWCSSTYSGRLMTTAQKTSESSNGASSFPGSPYSYSRSYAQNEVFSYAENPHVHRWNNLNGRATQAPSLPIPQSGFRSSLPIPTTPSGSPPVTGSSNVSLLAQAIRSQSTTPPIGRPPHPNPSRSSSAVFHLSHSSSLDGEGVLGGQESDVEEVDSQLMHSGSVDLHISTRTFATTGRLSPATVTPSPTASARNSVELRKPLVSNVARSSPVASGSVDTTLQINTDLYSPNPLSVGLSSPSNNSVPLSMLSGSNAYVSPSSSNGAYPSPSPSVIIPSLSPMYISGSPGGPFVMMPAPIPMLSPYQHQMVMTNTPTGSPQMVLSSSPQSLPIPMQVPSYVMNPQQSPSIPGNGGYLVPQHVQMRSSPAGNVNSTGSVPSVSMSLSCDSFDIQQRQKLMQSQPQALPIRPSPPMANVRNPSPPSNNLPPLPPSGSPQFVRPSPPSNLEDFGLIRRGDSLDSDAGVTAAKGILPTGTTSANNGNVPSTAPAPASSLSIGIASNDRASNAAAQQIPSQSLPGFPPNILPLHPLPVLMPRLINSNSTSSGSIPVSMGYISQSPPVISSRPPSVPGSRAASPSALTRPLPSPMVMPGSLPLSPPLPGVPSSVFASGSRSRSGSRDSVDLMPMFGMSMQSMAQRLSPTSPFAPLTVPPNPMLHSSSSSSIPMVRNRLTPVVSGSTGQVLYYIDSSSSPSPPGSVSSYQSRSPPSSNMQPQFGMSSGDSAMYPPRPQSSPSQSHSTASISIPRNMMVPRSSPATTSSPFSSSSLASSSHGSVSVIPVFATPPPPPPPVESIPIAPTIVTATAIAVPADGSVDLSQIPAAIATRIPEEDEKDWENTRRMDAVADSLTKGSLSCLTSKSVDPVFTELSVDHSLDKSAWVSIPWENLHEDVVPTLDAVGSIPNSRAGSNNQSPSSLTAGGGASTVITSIGAISSFSVSKSHSESSDFSALQHHSIPLVAAAGRFPPDLDTLSSDEEVQDDLFDDGKEIRAVSPVEKAQLHHSHRLSLSYSQSGSPSLTKPPAAPMSTAAIRQRLEPEPLFSASPLMLSNFACQLSGSQSHSGSESASASVSFDSPRGYALNYNGNRSECQSLASAYPSAVLDDLPPLSHRMVELKHDAATSPVPPTTTISDVVDAEHANQTTEMSPTSLVRGLVDQNSGTTTTTISTLSCSSMSSTEAIVNSSGKLLPNQVVETHSDVTIEGNESIVVSH